MSQQSDSFSDWFGGFDAGDGDGDDDGEEQQFPHGEPQHCHHGDHYQQQEYAEDDAAGWHHCSQQQDDDDETPNDSQEEEERRRIVSVNRRNHHEPPGDDDDDEEGEVDDDDDDDDDDEITVPTVLARMERLAVTVVDALDQNRMPTLVQYRRPFSREAMTSAANQTLTKRFTLQQARSFTSVLLVVAYCHALLLSSSSSSHQSSQTQTRRTTTKTKTTTVREVYYFYVTHFRSQRECDLAIWDACQLLGVPRHRLGLRAGSRGWFCGDLRLRSRFSGEIVWDGRNAHDGSSSQQGCPIQSDWLLPAPQRSFAVSMRNTVRCILVVEKEGIYQRLVQDGFWREHGCVLVTGKGFPDLATRACVHALHKQFKLPVRGLADCDPFGVLVLHCYSSRGANAATGAGGRGDRYRVPVEWVGLRPSQVRYLSSSSSNDGSSSDDNDNDNDNSHTLPSAVFQELTALDRKRLRETLLDERHPFAAANDERRRAELEAMLESKVELEALHWLGLDFCGRFVGHLLEHHEAKQQALLHPTNDDDDDDNNNEDDDDNSATDDNEGGWRDII